jgi:hypothetical protein
MLFRTKDEYLKFADSMMDEATLHLHIDFVPFTTGSKRGLDTSVSLKQALASQGFHGGSRGQTEWNQWIISEKEQLSKVMEKHGVEWQQLGTHDKHLNVENYKKEQRIKEVAVLDKEIRCKEFDILALQEKEVSIKNDVNDTMLKLAKTERALESIKEKERFIAGHAREYDDDPKYQLPEPKPMMTAKTYHHRHAVPIVEKLKNAIRSILLQYYEKTRKLQYYLDQANSKTKSLTDKIKKLEPENERLRVVERDYKSVERVLGKERVEEIISAVKEKEREQDKIEASKTKHVSKQRKANRNHDYVR